MKADQLTDRSPEERKRLHREMKTIEIMVKLFCRKNHQNGSGLCRECSEVLDYTNLRIIKCPYKENKPACNTCTIHCFKNTFKEKVREIMAFSGPRMMIYHPVYAFLHILDKHRKATLKRKTKTIRN